MTGAIQHRPAPRDDLLVFEVVGKIHRQDIEGMATTVAAAFDRFDVVDILVIMTVFDGVTLGAAFDPDALVAETRSLKHVRRYGVVGAPGWVRAMIEAADFIIPVDSRTFPETGLAHAWTWINAG